LAKIPALALFPNMISVHHGRCDLRFLQISFGHAPRSDSTTYSWRSSPSANGPDGEPDGLESSHRRLSEQAVRLPSQSSAFCLDFHVRSGTLKRLPLLSQYKNMANGVSLSSARPPLSVSPPAPFFHGFRLPFALLLFLFRSAIGLHSLLRSGSFLRA
jgi:hypothetical protein